LLCAYHGAGVTTPSVKVVDDSFDDNPGERGRTPANGRFEKTA
jgi:hypothetical protein